MIWVVISAESDYNKNVITMHEKANKSVKEGFRGAIDSIEAAGLEKLALS